MTMGNVILDNIINSANVLSKMKTIIINIIACCIFFSEIIQFIFGTLNQKKPVDLWQKLYGEYIFLVLPLFSLVGSPKFPQ